jgi:hypothetical protein
MIFSFSNASTEDEWLTILCTQYFGSLFIIFMYSISSEIVIETLIH